MSKQTVIQLLKESIDHELKLGTKMVVNWDMYLAMEKEQIINTWSEATAPDHEIGLSDAFYIISQVQKAEQYYDETYGGKQ
jgi:hypothetical protein